MPNTQSQEKIDLLRMLGAEVYPVPAVAYENPANYNHQARDFAKKLDFIAGCLGVPAGGLDDL